LKGPLHSSTCLAVGAMLIKSGVLQVDMVGGVLLARLLGEWGLMHQLTILRNVFLLGCPLLMPFASALYGRLHKGQKLSSLSHFELEVMLQQSLADQPPHRPGDHALPPPDTLSGIAPQICIMRSQVCIGVGCPASLLCLAQSCCLLTLAHQCDCPLRVSVYSYKYQTGRRIIPASAHVKISL